MAGIDLTSGTASAYGAGELQLQNKAPMDGTLRIVTDSANTASPLKLSTSLVQTTSTLKITTSDVAYIDAEDNSGNNRFTVSRAVASQLVTVDFASVPTALTTPVGAIRTATDGVNLANVMTFLENGNIGVRTDTPKTALQVNGSILAGNGLCSLSNTTGGYGAVGSNYYNVGGSAFRSQTDSVSQLSFDQAGFFFNTAGLAAADSLISFTTLAVLNSSGNLTIGNTTTSLGARLGIKGSGSTSATTSLLVQNSASATSMAILDDGNVGIGITAPLSSLHVEKASQDNIISAIGQSGYEGALFLSGAGSGKDANIVVGNSRTLEFHTTASATPVVSGTARMVLTSAGNVGIGTTAPNTPLSLVGEHVGGQSTFKIQPITSYALGGLSSIGFNDSDGVRKGLVLQEASGIKILTENTTPIRFEVNNSERGRWTTDGLCFNGDTAAANALDDYEEGTWTMGVSFGGASVGVTSSANTGTYTKIGRQVTVNGYLELTSKGSSTGSARITGLPFSIPNLTQNYATAGLYLGQITFANQFQGYGVVNTTTIQLDEITILGVISPIENGDFANNSVIMINYTYFV